MTTHCSRFALTGNASHHWFLLLLGLASTVAAEPFRYLPPQAIGYAACSHPAITVLTTPRVEVRSLLVLPGITDIKPVLRRITGQGTCRKLNSRAHLVLNFAADGELDSYLIRSVQPEGLAELDFTAVLGQLRITPPLSLTVQSVNVELLYQEYELKPSALLQAEGG